MNPLLRYKLKRLFGFLVGIGHMHKRDMHGLAVHLKKQGVSPKTIIDVGVADGTYELYSVWPQSKLLLVEAMSEFEQQTSYICGSHAGGGEYVIAAAGATDGSITVHYSADLHGSSTALPLPMRREIPQFKLDTLMERYRLAPPYLLKIDVQGAESAVLAGASDLLKNCEVVFLEAQLMDFANNGNCINELIGQMERAGFVPYDFYDGINRPLDGALGQIDVAFVKRDSRLRVPAVWASPEQIKRKNWRMRLRHLLGI